VKPGEGGVRKGTLVMEKKGRTQPLYEPTPLNHKHPQPKEMDPVKAKNTFMTKRCSDKVKPKTSMKNNKKTPWQLLKGEGS